MKLDSKRIVITGAAGFIGSHLTEELVARGAEVRAIVQYNSTNNWENLDFLPEETLGKVEVITGDIRDPFFVRKIVKDSDVVFHLAALIAIPYSYIAPREFVETNVSGTLNVMQACLDEGVEKVVHTSTSEVYGTALYTPIDEKHLLQGQSPYSASKIGADKIAESYHTSFDLPVATLRPFNTFGPRQSARAVIPTIITQILAGKEKIKLGALKPVRDLTYVKDTVKGFTKVAESEKTIGTVVNSGMGEGHSIEEVADKIKSLMDSDAKIELDKKRVRPEKSEVMKLICNNERIRELTNWKPEYTFEQGLEETIEFMRQNLDKYKTEIYNL